MANADGSGAYIGLGDQLLNIGDAQSFIDEGDSNKVFTINLVNKTAPSRRCSSTTSSPLLQDTASSKGA